MISGLFCLRFPCSYKAI